MSDQNGWVEHNDCHNEVEDDHVDADVDVDDSEGD